MTKASPVRYRDDMPKKRLALVEAEPTGTLFPDEEAGPWFVQGEWVETGGRVGCVGLHLWKGVRPVDGTTVEQFAPSLSPVGGTDLRQIPLVSLIDALRGELQRGLLLAMVADAVDAHDAHAAAYRLYEKGELSAEKANEIIASARASANRSVSKRNAQFDTAGPRRLSEDRQHFVQVTAVYLNAGSKPTKAVQEHFTVSYSTATKWVARARQLGLLEETSQGRANPARPTKKRGRK